MKIAIYARVSTKDRGQHPENQLAQLREFAKTQGWQIVREYVDHVSGKTSDRARLFADAAKRLQERVLKSDRTKAGLARAGREGRIGGRPRLVLDRDRVFRMDEDGDSQKEIAEWVAPKYPFPPFCEDTGSSCQSPT